MHRSQQGTECIRFLVARLPLRAAEALADFLSAPSQEELELLAAVHWAAKGVGHDQSTNELQLPAERLYDRLGCADVTARGCCPAHSFELRSGELNFSEVRSGACFGPSRKGLRRAPSTR